jgi:hypothetical protein
MGFKVECDRYGDLEDNGASSLRPLLPNGKRDGFQYILVEPSSDFVFHDEEEGRYFGSFPDQVVPEFGGGYSFKLWKVMCSRIIFQACHSDKFIREAAIAVAALRKSYATTRHLSANHYTSALQHFGRAI